MAGISKSIKTRDGSMNDATCYDNVAMFNVVTGEQVGHAQDCLYGMNVVHAIEETPALIALINVTTFKFFNGNVLVAEGEVTGALAQGKRPFLRGSTVM